MKCYQPNHPTEDDLWTGYTYPKGRLLPSCFGLAKISGFLITKTSANKRFLLCLFPSAYDAQTSLGAGLRCKCTTIFRSGQRSMNIFAKYVLFSELNISVQSLNLFKICDSQRFASCVVMHIKNRVGIRVLWIYICGDFSIANENKHMRIHNYFKMRITIRIMWCTNEKHQAPWTFITYTECIFVDLITYKR